MKHLLASLLVFQGFPIDLAAYPRLSLGWYDGFQLCNVMRPVVQEEVTRLFASIGVSIDWEDAPGARSRRADEIPINVVLLRHHPTEWGLEPTTLGIVMGRQEPLTTYIFVPRVFRVLGYAAERPHRCPVPRRVHYVSRALGRIIAHEVFHALAPDHPHAHDGLMRGHLDRNRLLDRGLTLDGQCAAALLMELRRVPTNSFQLMLSR